jgi:hypothetical protein
MRDNGLSVNTLPHFDQKRWSEAEPLARRNLPALYSTTAFRLCSDRINAQRFIKDHPVTITQKGNSKRRPLSKR